MATVETKRISRAAARYRVAQVNGPSTSKIARLWCETNCWRWPERFGELPAGVDERTACSVAIRVLASLTTKGAINREWTAMLERPEQ